MADRRNNGPWDVPVLIPSCGQSPGSPADTVSVQWLCGSRSLQPGQHHVPQLQCWKQGPYSQHTLLTLIPVLFLVPRAHLHSHAIQTKLFLSLASREPISGDFKALLPLLVPKAHHHVELSSASMGTPGGVWDPAMLCINTQKPKCHQWR